MLPEILDAKIDERNLLLMEREVIRVARPVLDGLLRRIVVAEQELDRGRRGDALEVWLANALLSVTFPFLIFYAVYLNYWPLVKQSQAAPAASAAAK